VPGSVTDESAVAALESAVAALGSLITSVSSNFQL
jgi:hypothetical protein